MSHSFDLYWSFRSPYSYLATPRLVEIARRYDVDVQVKVVLPLAVRRPEFFEKVNPLWPPYVLRDTTRLAEFLGLPFRWPRPDPIVQDLETRKVAEEQPYIWRLSRLGVVATDRGRGLPFLHEVSAIVFGGVDGWDRGSHLSEATQRAGLDLAELEAEVADRTEELDRRLESHQEQLKAAGHWGVPTMVFEGEPFFGQDRVDVLLWRMKQHGLEERPQG